MTTLESQPHLPSQFSNGFPRWAWLIFLALLVAAPASTKLAGSAWFLIVCMGAWAVWRLPVMAPASSGQEVLYSGVKYWLYFCLAAFGFKAVGMIYWSDPWGTRHFDFRILLIAFALRVLVPRIRLSAGQVLLLLMALTLASLSAIAVSYLHAQYDWPTPSNRINWAGGLAMLSCVLLPIAGTQTANSRWRIFAVIGVLVYISAILMSGARGAYLAFPWIVLCGLVVLRKNLCDGRSGPVSYRFIITIVIFVAAVPFLAPKVLEVPKERISIAVSEVRAVLSGVGAGRNVVDTSIGARVYMWQRSLEKIHENPWLGYGRAQRIEFIKTWGAEANAHIVKDQTHLHSEYINGMVDHGVFGLLSTLTYMIGLVWLTWHLRKKYPGMAMSTGGLAYIHFMMSFTDANSQTNNYSVMISLSLVSIFFLRLARSRSD